MLVISFSPLTSSSRPTSRLTNPLLQSCCRLPESVTGAHYAACSTFCVLVAISSQGRVICQQVIMSVHHLTRTLRALHLQLSTLILAVTAFITTDCRRRKTAVGRPLSLQSPPVSRDGGNETRRISCSVMWCSDNWESVKESQNPITMQSRLQGGGIITFCCHHLWHSLPLRLWKQFTGHTGARATVRQRRGESDSVRLQGSAYSLQTNCAGKLGVTSEERFVHMQTACFVWRVWCCAPRYGRHACAVLVDEVAPSIEHPAMVERHQRVSGRCGRVLPILTVCVLQGWELVLPQHLVHNKCPVGCTVKGTRETRWYCVLIICQSRTNTVEEYQGLLVLYRCIRFLNPFWLQHYCGIGMVTQDTELRANSTEARHRNLLKIQPIWILLQLPINTQL